MPTDQYHEPPEELAEEIRTFARMSTSLIEEAEAINWYAQHLAIERDRAAAAIIRDAQNEEFKHFSMDLESLLARSPRWRAVPRRILFQPGDIIEHGEEGEEPVEGGGAAADPEPRRFAPAAPATGSLGIGSLRGRDR